MNKIYYNVKQLKNALATGLLGLATLGPMTSCEKDEPGIDKNKIETTNNKNKGSEENDKQQVIDYDEVSEKDVLYCGLENFKGEVKENQENRAYYTDYASINFILEDGGTTLTLDLTTPDKGSYCIEFDVDKKKNLTPSKWYADIDDKEEFIKIFSKYRIKDEVYSKFGIYPPKLPLEIGNAKFNYYN